MKIFNIRGGRRGEEDLQHPGGGCLYFSVMLTCSFRGSFSTEELLFGFVSTYMFRQTIGELFQCIGLFERRCLQREGLF